MSVSVSRAVSNDRLELLAAYLKHGQLDFTFDFSVVCMRNTITGEESGCAMRLFPRLWPEHWTFQPWAKQGDVVFHIIRPLISPDTTALDTEGSISSFLGVSRIDYMRLLLPCGYIVSKAPWNKGRLITGATRYDVAQGIRNFIIWREENDGPTEEDTSHGE